MRRYFYIGTVGDKWELLKPDGMKVQIKPQKAILDMHHNFIDIVNMRELSHNRVIRDDPTEEIWKDTTYLSKSLIKAVIKEADKYSNSTWNIATRANLRIKTVTPDELQSTKERWQAAKFVNKEIVAVDVQEYPGKLVMGLSLDGDELNILSTNRFVVKENNTLRAYPFRGIQIDEMNLDKEVAGNVQGLLYSDALSLEVGKLELSKGTMGIDEIFFSRHELSNLSSGTPNYIKIPIGAAKIIVDTCVEVMKFLSEHKWQHDPQKGNIEGWAAYRMISGNYSLMEGAGGIEILLDGDRPYANEKRGNDLGMFIKEYIAVRKHYDWFLW